MFRGACRVYLRVGHSGVQGFLGIGAKLLSSYTSSQGLSPC